MLRKSMFAVAMGMMVFAGTGCSLLDSLGAGGLGGIGGIGGVLLLLVQLFLGTGLTT